MDLIASELWNKRLAAVRSERQQAYKTCVELFHAHSGRYYTDPLVSVLYHAAADNLETLLLHWREIYQGAWVREKPKSPRLSAAQAEGEVLSILTAEATQIEHEIQAVGTQKGFTWKPEETSAGKLLLDQKTAVLQAGAIARIADLARDREEEIQRGRAGRREIWATRLVSAIFIIAGTLGGVWIGADLNARRSRADRDYIDQKLATHLDGQRQLREEVRDLKRSNRRIAFWTEKTPGQIDREMAETRERLASQIRDIREETARKMARIESEYARSGRDGGSELDMRKKSLQILEAKLIQSAEEKAQKKLNDLAEQKNNIQR